MARKYWLMKSEPDAYSFEDLMAEPEQTACWDGIRNYQARNFMMEMKVGDFVLFYHSSAKPPHVAGTAKVARESYPDHTQYDEKSKYYDPKAPADAPRWHMVDLQAMEKLPRPVSLNELKENSRLADMRVTQKGQRLSVQPVTKKEFDEVLRMARN